MSNVASRQIVFLSYIVRISLRFLHNYGCRPRWLAQVTTVGDTFIPLLSLTSSSAISWWDQRPPRFVQGPFISEGVCFFAIPCLRADHYENGTCLEVVTCFFVKTHLQGNQLFSFSSDKDRRTDSRQERIYHLQGVDTEKVRDMLPGLTVPTISVPRISECQ